MSLWTFVCSVLLCTLWEKEHWRIVVGSSFSHKGHFFLSQSSQSSRSFLAHISSSQNAFGIQSSQSVIANEDTIRRQKAAYVQPIGVSRWSLPFPSGEGPGEGPLSFWPLCVLFNCFFLWEIEHPNSMRWHTNNSLGSFISHRAHRVHWAFWRTFRAHRTPSAYREHRAILLKIGWKLGKRRIYRVIKNHYIAMKETSSK